MELILPVLCIHCCGCKVVQFRGAILAPPRRGGLSLCDCYPLPLQWWGGGGAGLTKGMENIGNSTSSCSDKGVVCSTHCEKTQAAKQCIIGDGKVLAWHMRDISGYPAPPPPLEISPHGGGGSVCLHGHYQEGKNLGAGKSCLDKFRSPPSYQIFPSILRILCAILSQKVP